MLRTWSPRSFYIAEAASEYNKARPLLDHLVLAARTLDEGCDYLANTTGVVAGPGGKHSLMGTHNRLMRLGDTSYIEVLAIDPDAPTPNRPRWFALDDPLMQARLLRGPSLVAWVARTSDIRACTRAIQEAGHVRALSRGALAWHLTIRDDGMLPFDGVLPSFIEWSGDAHPTDSLPDRGLHLLRLAGVHPRSAEIRASLDSLNCVDLIELEDGEPSLRATIATNRGIVELR